MLAYSEFEFFSVYSYNDRKCYCLYDDFGCIIGVKEEAPAEFKAAYEEYRKKREEWEAAGIDV